MGTRLLLLLTAPLAVLAQAPDPAAVTASATPGQAAVAGNAVRQLSLDPDACYRVRDLQLWRDDARMYLTDGWLILARPIAGRRLGAVFAATETGDDGELTLRPPDRSERTSLAKYTGSPNLSEHFKNAVFVFTDRAADEIAAHLTERNASPSPEMGHVLAQRHDGVMRNLAGSFQVRLVDDLLTKGKAKGLFFAAIAGNSLGNFDLLYDPSMQEQIILGQVTSTGGRPGFDIWTSFQSRASRQRNEVMKPGMKLEDFRIEVTIEQDLMLRAVTRVRVQALSPIEGAVHFEIAPAMEVTEVKWDGVQAEVFRRESLRAGLMTGSRNEPFLVVPPQPLTPGTTAELEFHHHGRVIMPAGNGVYYVGARMNWYPCRGQDFATFDLKFRAPRQLNLVATGDLVKEGEQEEWKLSHWRTPVPVRVAGFNVGEYEKVSVARGPYRIEVYANRKAETALQRRPVMVMMPPPIAQRGVSRRPAELIAMATPAPPDPTARLREMAEEVMTGLEWMSSRFGPPLLKNLTVSPIPGFFGQGFPGLIYLSTLTYLHPSQRPVSQSGPGQETFYDEILYAHELAHQWWGNLVTSATYRDDWIQEALANYSALMVLEKKKGAKAMQSMLDQYRDGLRDKAGKLETIESAGPLTWGVRLHAETGSDPWRAIVYDKGAWVFHMLRRRLGDEQFIAMLAALRQRYQSKALTTERLQEIAAEFSPKGLPDPTLEDFFDSWIYSTGIPVLSMTASVKGKAPAVQLHLTVRQSDVSDDFGIDVPVEIRVPGEARPRVEWVRTSSEPAKLTVKLKRAPSKVELAPGGAVLAAVK